MNPKIIPVILLIIAICAVAFAITESTKEGIQPTGPMTGYNVLHPIGVPMGEIIYVPAYPGDECAKEDRVLIDYPVKIIDADGRVYWQWLYENRDNARNRSQVKR